MNGQDKKSGDKSNRQALLVFPTSFFISKVASPADAAAPRSDGLAAALQDVPGRWPSTLWGYNSTVHV